MRADTSTRVDVHQHIWSRPLVELLAGRTSPPYVRRADGVTVLHAAGEQASVIEVAHESVHRARLREDGLDVALVALSSPIGIEALARDSATVMIDAHLDGVDRLGPRFVPWGPVALDRPDPGDVDRLLARGCVGISIPAGALAGPDSLTAVGPVLRRTAAHGAPVFVHPGPGPACAPADRSPTEPHWWRAMTAYVAQMQAAWLTFAAFGRREHPDLEVLFAMLAGGAPLHAERLLRRGGPAVALSDQRIFYDTSSYGPVAIKAMGRQVGCEQLVYGSDRPVIESIPTDRDQSLQVNGARFAAARVASTGSLA